MKIFLILLLSLYSLSSVLAQTLKFENLADMPTGRGAISSASDGAYFYVCNGFSAKEKFTGLIENYNVANNEWSLLTDSLIPKQFPSSVVAGRELYVFNGDLKDGTLNAKMEVVDISTGQIQFLTDNPRPAHAGGVAVWNEIIYAFGGKISPDKLIYSNNLYKFDPATKVWTKLANMPEKKETKGVVVDGNLYVIGGYNGNPSNRIAKYDIQTDKWTKLTKLPFGISAHSVAAYGDKVYVVFDFTNQSFIGYFDIPANKFVILEQNGMTGRRHAGVHIVKDKLYIMGGNTSAAMQSCLRSTQVAILK